MTREWNRLPVPTWNKLKVNALSGEALKLPETSPDGFPAALCKIELPEHGVTERALSGAQENAACAHGKEETAAKRAADEAGTAPEHAAQNEALWRAADAGTVFPESGVGADFDLYVAAHANVKGAYRVSGSADGVLRMETEVDGSHPAAVLAEIYAEAGSSLTLLQTARMRGGLNSAHQGTDGQEAAARQEKAAEAIKAANEADACGTVSAKASGGFYAELTRIYAARGAKVRVIQVQLLDDAAVSCRGLSVRTEEGASVEVLRVVLGSKTAANGLCAELFGKDSSCELKTVYFGDGTRLYDFNDTALHLGRGTQSELYTAGALADESQKVLRGTIDFRKGAVGAAGHEQEEVLLLSERAVNKTVPLILCGEEFVEGQHAASIGRPNERELYYLMSRGLSEQAAKAALIMGRFAPILDKVPDEALRAYLADAVAERVGAL